MGSEMTARVVCGSCLHAMDVTQEHLGKTIYCTRCGSPLDFASGSNRDLPVSEPLHDHVESHGETTRLPIHILLLSLFFRPRFFFQNVQSSRKSQVTVICAQTFGMATVIDHSDMKWSMGAENIVGLPWDMYWATVVIVGLVACILFFLLGAWWYRVRLSWSGAVSPNSELARKVYLFTAQIVALPILLTKVAECVMYPTPVAAHAGSDSLWYTALLVFPFWSIWCSFVGAKTAFDIRRVAGIVWFLVLPMLVLLVTIGAVVTAMAFLAQSNTASMKGTLVHDSDAVTFSYPSDWEMQVENTGYTGQTSILVQWRQDAFVRIMIYESDSAARQQVADFLQRYGEMAQIGAFQKQGDIRLWGSYRGVGRRVRGSLGDAFVGISVFVSHIGDRVFLGVQEVCATADQPYFEPGFELVRSTLRVKPRRGNP